MTRIVTFGEIMLRLSKPGHERFLQGNTFRGDYGGSEANVATSLALLGDDSRYVTRVPDNMLGEAALMHLRQYGVDTSRSLKGGDRLGTYYFEPSAGLRNSLVVYDRANSSFFTLRHGMIDWEHVMHEADVFHCSGITCGVSRDALNTTMDALREADKRDMRIGFDINYRKGLWKYGADAHEVLHEAMQFADFIFGDQDEWEVASGLKQVPMLSMTSADWQPDVAAYTEYFEGLHKQFPRCRTMYIALRNQMSSTHHTISGIIWHEGKVYTGRVYDVYPVLDPMGVGDAMVAAYLHMSLKRPDDVEHNLAFSISAGAIKNTISGDQNIVTEEEIARNMGGSAGRIDR